jgi:ATP-binding cassette subfamily C protein
LSWSVTAAAALCGFLWFTAGQRGVQGAELALLALIFLRLASRMMSIQSSLQQLARTLPIFEAYQQLLDTLCHRPEGQSTSAPHPPRPLRQELTLEAVNYRYPGSEVDVLQALDLNLKAGKTIALCGPSGAGKSTLADLCLGMLQPTSGRVLLDQQPLANDSLAGWRQAVAYVPQDVFLFNDTLRRNLTFLAPAASDEELWQALASAAAKDLVKALPQQLDTVVGERGVRLSGGERQRIALARALLRQPSLLVLDEATSSLDSHNERLVRQAIDNLHGTMTILVIAHRLSTIRHADQIAVMQAGRIVQRGAWDELIADTDGPFASMVDAAAI